MRLLVLALLALAGCDALTSTATAVGVVTKTPDLANAAGMDPSLVSSLPITDVANRNATVGLVVLGERESVTSTTFTATAGATVTLGFGSTNVSLCDNGDGTYSGTSVSGAGCANTNLQYTADTTYTFEASTLAKTYTMSVVAPSGADASDVTFTPALASSTNANGATLPGHDRNTQLVVDWSAADSSASAFVTVYRIDYVGSGSNAYNANSWQASSQNPIYSNLPESASDYFDLITGNTGTSETIPASAFSASGLYFVVVTLINVDDTTDGLSLGSGAVAGAGTAFAFWVP